jgi:hypothetical protein
VLTGVDPAVPGGQLGDLLGDRAHRGDLARPAQVDERPDVQAAHRAVPVEPGAQTVAFQDGGELFDVRDQRLRRYRGVFDEGQRAAAADAGRHEQAEPGLAHLEHGLLLLARHRAEGVIAMPVGGPGRGQLVDAGGDLRGRIAEELDEHQRVRIALEDVADPCVLDPAAGQLEDLAVDQLHRAGVAVQGVRGRGDRGGGRGEVAHGDGAGGGLRHQPHQRFGDNGEGALGADDQLADVEFPVVEHAVEPVAARVPPERRIALERIGFALEDLRQLLVKPPLEAVRVGSGGQLV